MALIGIFATNSDPFVVRSFSDLQTKAVDVNLFLIKVTLCVLPLHPYFFKQGVQTPIKTNGTPYADFDNEKSNNTH